MVTPPQTVLYNYKIRPDTSILENAINTNRKPGEETVIKETVDEAVCTLKGGSHQEH